MQNGCAGCLYWIVVFVVVIFGIFFWPLLLVAAAMGVIYMIIPSQTNSNNTSFNNQTSPPNQNYSEVSYISAEQWQKIFAFCTVKNFVIVFAVIFVILIPIERIKNGYWISVMIICAIGFYLYLTKFRFLEHIYNAWSDNSSPKNHPANNTSDPVNISPLHQCPVCRIAFDHGHLPNFCPNCGYNFFVDETPRGSATTGFGRNNFDSRTGQQRHGRRSRSTMVDDDDNGYDGGSDSDGD